MPQRGDLLERDREVAALTSALAAVGDSEGAAVLIEGPAGIGKSRLLAELRGLAAADDCLVLAARGSELEREYPYGVVRQLFEPMLVGADDRDMLLGGAAGAARPVFDPEGEAGPGDASFAALNGLYWLAVNMSARRPLVLAIDDLHWADRPSLRFVAYLLRRLEGLPVLVAATLRPSEPGADEALLAEIGADPSTTSIQPAPLSDEGVAAIVRTRLGADADGGFCAACGVATGGNPLLLRELVRALDSERVEPTRANAGTVRQLGPRAARRAVLLRLARLPGEATAVARAAAVLGDGADLSAIAALAELDEPTAARTTGELARVEILRAEAPLGFIHPLVREAVYLDIAPGEREIMHATAGELLHQAGASPERIAAHTLAMPARGQEWVVDTLSAAAHAALAKGAADSAVSYLRRALDEPPPPERRFDTLMALGGAEALTSGPAAAEHLRAAYDLAPGPVARAQVAFVLGWTLVFTGSFADAVALTGEAAAALEGADEDLEWRLEAIATNARQFADARDPEVDALLEGYRDNPPTGSAGANMVAAQVAYDWATRGGPADRCAQIALGALEDGTLVETANGGGPWVSAAITLALTDSPHALDVCNHSVADAHRRGSLFAAAGAHTFRGFTLLRRGDLADAEDSLRTGFDEVEMWGLDPGRPYVSAFLADTLIERGDLPGARAALERGGVMDPVPASIQACWWAVARTRLLLAEGNHADALDRADELGRRFARVAPSPTCIPWRSLRAEALDRMGRSDEAAEAAREELEIAREVGAPGALGRSLRVLGTILRADDGMAALEEAVAVLDGSPARLELAKALAAHGGALRHARRPTDAREPLRRALELASVLGADPLAEHARAELHAAGARPRADVASGVGALTASERRVVDLAVEGGSNRDIAQTLYVTPKTVEVHLSNAYRKLGIRSRRELAGVLA